MKLTTLILFILPVTFLNAQKDFEGMIRYKATSNEIRVSENDNADSGEIKIFFTAGKILVVTNKDTEDGEERTLILVDSAKSYILDMKNKSYRAKKLRATKQVTAGKEKIAGYMATPLQGGMGNSNLMLGANATLWFADSLFFKVPAKYEGNDELLMVKNNHILLKAIINLGDYGAWREDMTDEETADESTTNIAMIEAVEVAAGKVNLADFTIPSDFVKWNYPVIYPDSVITEEMDTAMMMVDTSAAAPDTKPVMKKDTAPTKPKSAKNKTTDKSSLRKED
ncbi:MAG TPA: hypothetical protein PKC72_15430 [Chitinophagaceae bacterium]|nr:hypothetical protein [Chitinophagaceae bacterium]